MSVAPKDQALAKLDPVWSRIRDEARDMVEREPLIGSLVHATVLHHESFEDALSYRIAQKLAAADMSALILQDIARQIMNEDTGIGAAARADAVAV